MEEIWKDIPDFLGIYQASSNGRIKALSKVVIIGNNVKRLMPEKILKEQTHFGYKCICLKLNKKNKYKKVHRLIAEAFIPNPENKLTVNHINGIKTDNRIENLEWNTHAENNIHAFKVLKRKSSTLGKYGDLNHKSKPIIQYDLGGVLIKRHGSADEASRFSGIHSNTIRSASKRSNHIARGFIWIYDKNIPFKKKFNSDNKEKAK